MRAIVHSIHSQVPETVSGLGPLETIVSMDSHLDVSLGGDDSIYPPSLRLIVGRTAAHAALRGITGGLSALGRPPEGDAPRLVIVVPEAMLAAHVEDIEERLPRTLRVPDQAESVSSYLGFLAGDMGIEVYQSPPKSLGGLAGRLKGGPWLLDIDVDYMQEMQRECYTRIINPGQGILQSVSRVVQFVKDARPETITISEAKVAAIRGPKSAFSSFLGKLEDLGYQIEEKGVFVHDAQVEKEIALCREFYRTVSGRLMQKHMAQMLRGETEGFQKEEAAAARRFFKDKGYGPG